MFNLEIPGDNSANITARSYYCMFFFLIVHLKGAYSPITLRIYSMIFMNLTNESSTDLHRISSNISKGCFENSTSYFSENIYRNYSRDAYRNFSRYPLKFSLIISLRFQREKFL